MYEQQYSPSFVQLCKHPAFICLWLAFFLTNLGSVLLLSTLVLKTYLQTASSFSAGVVYVVQWFLPILFLPLNGWINNQFPIKKSLIIIQFVTAFTSLGVGYFFKENLALFFVLLCLRGFCENTMKSAGAVALKNYMPTGLLPLSVSLYDSARYLGALCGGVLAMFFIHQMSSWQVSIINAGLLFGSIGLYALLAFRPAIRPAKPQFFSYWKEVVGLLKKDKVVTAPLVHLIVITGLFQGFHYIARTTLPMEHLSLSLNNAALMQGFVSFAFLFGALWVSHLIKRNIQSQRRYSLPFCILYTALALGASVITHIPWLGLTSYFFFLFFFEVAYSLENNTFTVQCPIEHLSYMNAFKSGAATAAMALMTMLYGLMVDWFGFATLTLLLAVGCLLFAIKCIFAQKINNY